MENELAKKDRILFIRESNRIEGILRDPTGEEVEEFYRFLRLDRVYAEDVVKFVSIYQPDAQLRDHHGLNVCVGSHIAPPGGQEIAIRLDRILSDAKKGASPYRIHCEYETLHPFTDGNGRSGRALWAWQMVNHGHHPGLRLGFLHAFYYQTLANCSDRGFDGRAIVNPNRNL